MWSIFTDAASKSELKEKTGTKIYFEIDWNLASLLIDVRGADRLETIERLLALVRELNPDG